MAARRVLVTGATRGLGEALTRHFLALGDDVVGCGRAEAALSHERYHHRVADVTSPEQVDGLFAEVRDRFGVLDVLINCAGVASMNLIALTPVASARRVIDTNVLGPFACTRAAVRLLRRSGAGRIVNLSSVAVPMRLEGEAIYAASKSAVETLTRIAARELAPFGITCNAVGPSPVRTALLAGVPEEKLQRLIDAQATRRWAVAEDVINVVEFFLQPASGMVTGQVIYLGGAG